MDLNQSLAVIGKLSQKELNAIRAEIKAVNAELEANGDQMWGGVDDGFHSDHISQKDIDQAKYFGVRFVATIAQRNDYCAFWHDKEGKLKIAQEIVTQHFPELYCKWNAEHHNDKRNFYSGDPFLFQGYYALEHDDTSISTTHQLMMILRNGGHRLYSEVGNTLLTPKAGDIVVLCTHKKHALYPCATKNVAHCAISPLRFYSVPFFLIKPFRAVFSDQTISE